MIALTHFSAGDTLRIWSSSPLALSERNPPQTLMLSSNEVHLWCVPLDLTASCIQRLQQILTPDEENRAERFHFSKDREYFIAARGLLRVILSPYLGIEPSHLRFCYSPNGKPTLSSVYGKDPLRFNVSHSRGLALYAVTRERNIGVDLEYTRSNFPCEEIAERFFSSQESAMLRMLPSNLRYKAFFSCWTRKEAYVKATGKGLSIPLDQFDVSLVPGEPAALLRTQWDPQEAYRWSLQELTPAPGYVAALAVERDLSPQSEPCPGHSKSSVLLQKLEKL